MEELIVKKEDMEKWTEKLKKLLDVNSEKRVAEEMDISPSQYSQMKNSGKFPYEKFFILMRKKNFSIDDFFKIKDNNSSDIISKSKIPFYKKKEKYIILQEVDNSDEHLSVIKYNEQYIIFNNQVKEFTEDGIYIFMQSNFILVRKMKFYINSDDLNKLALELIDINNENDVKVIEMEHLKHIDIIGKAEYIIEKKDVK